MSFDFKRLQEPFPSSDIEWRIQRAGKSDQGVWAFAVLYVSGTAVAKRLDEVLGPENWRDEYKPWHVTKDGLPAQLCGISIKIDGEWVTKWDGAEATQNDPIKGGLTQSFKRAAAKWGVGRYLSGAGTFPVRVCDRTAPHAVYGQYSEKQGDRWIKQTFYWIKPKLPEHLLPASERGQGQASNQQRQAPSSPPPPPAETAPPSQSNPVSTPETTLGPEGAEGPVDQSVVASTEKFVALIDNLALAIQAAGGLDSDPRLSVATKKAAIPLYASRMTQLAAGMSDLDELSRHAKALAENPMISQWTKNQILPPLRKRFSELRSQLQPA